MDYIMNSLKHLLCSTVNIIDAFNVSWSCASKTAVSDGLFSGRNVKIPP